MFGGTVGVLAFSAQVLEVAQPRAKDGTRVGEVTRGLSRTGAAMNATVKQGPINGVSCCEAVDASTWTALGVLLVVGTDLPRSAGRRLRTHVHAWRVPCSQPRVCVFATGMRFKAQLVDERGELHRGLRVSLCRGCLCCMALGRHHAHRGLSVHVARASGGRLGWLHPWVVPRVRLLELGSDLRRGFGDGPPCLTMIARPRASSERPFHPML